MSGGLVSVITPFFNPGRYLAEAIDSVLAQRYAPVELLLVDDGSTDGSADACIRHVLGHPDVRLLRLPHNQGQAAARNAALGVARGDFVTFLDADDVMLADRIAFQVDYLARHPDVDIVIGAAEYASEPGAEAPAWLRNPAATRHPHRNPMTMLMGRHVVDRVGLFDPSYRLGEDTEWLFRAALRGLVIARVERPLIRRRLHGANLTSSAEEMHRATRRIVLGVVRQRLAARRRRS